MSNFTFPHLQHLVSALEQSASRESWISAEIFLFTDNAVAESAFYLGMAHERGAGGLAARNLPRARHYYELAAARGNRQETRTEANQARLSRPKLPSTGVQSSRIAWVTSACVSFQRSSISW